jgi:hypothetical protein
MQRVVNGLNYWIDNVPKEFSKMTELEVLERPMPHKWSKKEVLGHLCDSAINNLPRFNMRSNHLSLLRISKMSGWSYKIIKTC